MVRRKAKFDLYSRQSPRQYTAHTMFRNARLIFGGVFVFLAGVHVNRLDHSLTRMMNIQGDWTKTITSSGGDTSVPDSRNVQLAFDQSYGFFDDLPEADWKIHQEWARLQPNHRYGFNPSRQYGNPALWYYNNYNPIFNCPHGKRVWGIGDGPKWICDPHRLVRQAERRKAAGLPGPHCLIYSVGSNGNYEFEDGRF